jgi:hypothetical protein
MPTTTSYFATKIICPLLPWLYNNITFLNNNNINDVVGKNMF